MKKIYTKKPLVPKEGYEIIDYKEYKKDENGNDVLVDR